MIKHFHTLVFTHHNLELSHIGQLHIDVEMQESRFKHVKHVLGLDEVLFLSTCNRVEFFLVNSGNISEAFVSEFFSALYPNMNAEQVSFFAKSAVVYSDYAAVEHVLRVASSIDSLVIGEREIITQVRQAYDLSKEQSLSGDFMRLLLRHTIETAKKVYTETKISLKPVSIVSIAYQRLQGMDIQNDARVLVIGAGVTNTAMVRFLKKHGMTKFVVFNRTLSKAEALATELNGEAYPLSALGSYTGGFDLLVTCTGSEDIIVTPELYAHLLQGDTKSKVTIDLALPSDIDPAVHEQFATRQISINVLQTISDAHLQERSQEVIHVESIIAEAVEDFTTIARTREVEIAMREVPELVKKIKATALNEVFKTELDQLDAESLEVVQKIMSYMEKKYMSVPMKMAKEILIKS